MKQHDWRRFVSLLLCLAILTLAGCGGQTRQGFVSTATTPTISETQAETQSETNGASSSICFADVWHDEYDFSEIPYEHYDLASFQPLVDAVRAFASGSGDRDSFADADNAICWELYYINTLDTLANLTHSQNATDEAAMQENLYTSQLCYDAMDLYQSAMHDVAVSSHVDVMRDSYADWQISSFADYRSDGSSWDVLEQETTLVQQYYSLAAQENVDYDAILDLFVELVQLRQEIAEAYGYDSYADYAYDATYSRNYTPADSQALWTAVKEKIVPVIERCGDEVYTRTADVFYSDRIDCSEETILQALGDTAARISPNLQEAYQFMVDHRLYDISPSDTKMNTGFTVRLDYYNEPFIFNAPSGTYYDYTDLFHEFGHFTNAYYTTSDLIFGWPDNDLRELQAQGMEIMFMPYYEDIFGGADGDAIRDEMRMNMLYSITDGAMYDEFQQRVYASENLSPEKIQAIFAEVYHAYGNEEYDGWENSWMDIAHNFEYPFYYISYAVSAIPALELCALLDTDPQQAVDRYLQVAAMDSELYYFTDALEEAGLRDAFQQDSLKAVAEAADGWFQ
ncbi:MAG: M3 family metallopeptidase [Oscillospiraceae bacterium]|nr:M3 family metallopeptidase [Oscillospiraceae bacterium]